MDSERIQEWVQSINLYLEEKRRADWLWQQMERHVHTSHLAEWMGDRDLVPKHLRAAALLLLEANHAQAQVQQHLPAPE